jgi:hypothetical protein
MSWSDAVANSLEETEFPAKIHRLLEDLRQHDKTTAAKTATLKRDEAKLLDELRHSLKERPSKLDEAALQGRADSLLARRQGLSLQLDDQQKKAMAIYNLLDERISTLDADTNPVGHLLVNSGMGGDGERGKKRRRNRDDEADAVVRDANEPTYCICGQVSYGLMIGCDNVDCPIEWFHLVCVGLTEPQDPWFCPQCKAGESSGGGGGGGGGGDGGRTKGEDTDSEA